MLHANVVFVATVLGLAGQGAAMKVGARATFGPARCSAAHMQTAAAQSTTAVQSLLDANRAAVDSLAAVAPGMDELTLLRFALAFPDQAEASQNLKDTLAWRASEGKAIVDSAAEAVAKATAGGGWDNEPVRAAAPYAAP